MPTNWIRRLRASISSLPMKWNAYLENERKLKAEGRDLEPGATVPLILFVVLWLLILEFVKHP